jgi:rhodanese-related sulfurtransferase
MFFGNSIPEMNPKEVNDKFNKGEFVIIDIREQDEIDAAHIDGSIFIPMRDLINRLDEIPKDKDVGFLCRSGVRSGQVTSFLIRQGYGNVKNIKGGIKKWKEEVDPTLNPI